MEKLSETEGRIGDPDASLRRADADWAAASMTAAQQAVRAGFSDGRKLLTALSRVGLGGTSLAKAIRGCLPHARGWACTALSMRPNFRLERGLFDLVIIDEASQCSLATALPLAYRAKRLAVIGDPHQLTPVVTALSDALVRKIAASERFDNDDLARRGIHHKEGSAYPRLRAGRRTSPTSRSCSTSTIAVTRTSPAGSIACSMTDRSPS